MNNNKLITNAQQIDIQSEMNRIRKNIEKMETGELFTQKNKYHQNYQEKFQLVNEQQRIIKEELIGFYEDVKETFIDIKSILKNIQNRQKNQEEIQKETKMQIKNIIKQNRQFQQENEQLKQEQESLNDQINSINKTVKISFKKQEDFFNNKIEQLSVIINNQQKQIEILNEQNIIKKQTKQIQTQNTKISILENMLKQYQNNIETQLFQQNQKNCQLQKEIEESTLRNENTQKRIKIVIGEFIQNITEQNNNKNSYLNNWINQLEEQLNSLNN